MAKLSETNLKKSHICPIWTNLTKCHIHAEETHMMTKLKSKNHQVAVCYLVVSDVVVGEVVHVVLVISPVTPRVV